MSQNLISLELSADEWTGVDGALDTLERIFVGLISLTPKQRIRLVKMGDKSESFCRQAMNVMSENTAVLPRNMDLADVQRDLATHDALRPRLVRLTRLLEKANHTDLALGSDVMSAALEGYAFLKISGKGEGLHGLRKALSQRFDNTARKASTPEPVPDLA